MDYLKYLGNKTTTDARCTREVKSRIAHTNAGLNKKALFTNEKDINLRKNLVQCCVWNVALYGTETCRFGE